MAPPGSQIGEPLGLEKRLRGNAGLNRQATQAQFTRLFQKDGEQRPPKPLP